MRFYSDFLVLGSGVAGLSFALEAAKHGRVIIVTKRQSNDSATAWAQGGIAAVMNSSDSFRAHIDDTLKVGCGLCYPSVVEMVVRQGPERIQALCDMGAQFSQTRNSSLDLTREGGHSARRVVHAEDFTGRELQRVLLEAVCEHPQITVCEHHMAIDLIELSKWGGARQVAGAYVLEEDNGVVHSFLAHTTVLATGGAGKVYLYTSNPDVATGDGLAMAYRAGASLANMEFFQFHPTCLYHPAIKNFLISEALRGEGGILRRRDGVPFMEEHHAQKDLAPRDAVARAIDYEMKRSGDECVFLDMQACTASYLQDRFPNIYATCLRYGIDITREPIPVVPAAHYMCGGIKVDTTGQSSIPGLWAVGEVACTGLHGANRLASNSLLEGLVFAHHAAQQSARSMSRHHPFAEVPDWDVGEAAPSDEAVVVTQNWDELRRFMWNYVGIVRSTKRLQRAARRIALLQDEIREYYWQHLVTRDMLELRNIADVAQIIVSSAAARRESRGLHYTLDYPERDDEHCLGDTHLIRGAIPYIR